MTRTAKAFAAIALLGIFSATLASAQESPKVNVNSATEAELAYLPGVGEATASNISYAREQGWSASACEDLEMISGIGPKSREKMCPHVIFSGETTATSKIGGKSKSVKKFKRPSSDNEG